jgi:hypothetical protein
VEAQLHMSHNGYKSSVLGFFLHTVSSREKRGDQKDTDKRDPPTLDTSSLGWAEEQPMTFRTFTELYWALCWNYSY